MHGPSTLIAEFSLCKIFNNFEEYYISIGETQENVNKLAERVLLRLHQKLQGVEDGVQLSLSGQVNHLIQEARNPKNLARLFPGWQPFI